MHAGDEHLAAREADDDAAITVGAVALRDALEVRRVQDLPFGVAGRVVRIRTDEEIEPEEILPRQLGGHLHRQVVLRVRSHVNVGDEMLALIQVLGHTVPEGVELIAVEWMVDGSPVDLVPGVVLIDNEAVHRGTASALACFHHQRSVGCQLAFIPYQCQFDEACRAQIRVGFTHVDLTFRCFENGRLCRLTR